MNFFHFTSCLAYAIFILPADQGFAPNKVHWHRHMTSLTGATGMYTHVDNHGRKLKFVNAKAYRRWKREQEAKYVPTLSEDLEAFATPTLGVGVTMERKGSLTRNRKGNKKLMSPKRHKVFDAA